MQVRLGLFSPLVQNAANAVILAGITASRIGFSKKPLKSEKKFDAGYGHVATTTAADHIAQRMILRFLSRRSHQARFLTEEKAEKMDAKIVQGVITAKDFHTIAQGVVYGIDPIDGTSMFKNRLWEWSSSVGVMVDGQHIGGAIFAPMLRGGILLVGERGKGVMMFENSGKVKSRPVVPFNQKPKDSVVYIGPDIFFLNKFAPFMSEIGPQLRTMNCTGSCAVGLAYVAAGRIDALIQPAQKAWDWFAGYPLVEGVGGKMQCYHYRDGAIVPLNAPDIASYDPSCPNMAFIAGVPSLVDFLFETLKKTYQVSAA